jgi:GR25 family glycosyltransferase involved in LPS biosynthesis
MSEYSDGAHNKTFARLIERFGPYPEARDRQTLVISMDNSKGEPSDRYRKTSQALTDVGLPHERWRAIRGKSLTTPNEVGALVGTRAIYSITQGRDSMWDIVSWGACGCALSHAAIWRHVVENSLTWVLVLEDDAVPALPEEEENDDDDSDTKTNTKRNMQERVEALVKEAGGAEKFDVIMLQHKTAFWHGGRHKTEQEWRGSQNLRRSYGMGLYAAAYVVTRRGALQLLRNLFPLDLPVDVRIYALARFCKPVGGKKQLTKSDSGRNSGSTASIGTDFVLLQATPQLFKHPLVNNFIATDINNVSLKDATIFVPKQIALPLAIIAATLILALTAALITAVVRLIQSRKRLAVVDTATQASSGDSPIKQVLIEKGAVD